jgi:hypothetical protein
MAPPPGAGRTSDKSAVSSADSANASITHHHLHAASSQHHSSMTEEAEFHKVHTKGQTVKSTACVTPAGSTDPPARKMSECASCISSAPNAGSKRNRWFRKMPSAPVGT